MAIVLAIEPQSDQAEALHQLLSPCADTDVVVVASKDAAVAAINERIPDLVLVGARLPARDEDALIAHLRTVPDAGHLQTATIPQLRQDRHEARRGQGIFGRRTRRRTDEVAGCDPTQFAAEVVAYLARAKDVKAAVEQRRAVASLVADCSGQGAMHSSSPDESPAYRDGPRLIEEPASGLTSAQDDSGAAHRGAGVSPRFSSAAPAEAAATTEAADRDSRPGPEAAAQTVAAELDRVRADAEHTLAVQLAAAEARHREAIACLETESDASRVAAIRGAQAAATAQTEETLAVELDRVRVDAERTLAAELAGAEERHRVAIARLETEAAENSDIAARQVQTTTAELERVRADAERMLAAELAAAEESHRADTVRLEAQAAAKSDAAAMTAQTAAEARAAQTLAGELDRARADAERTLAAQLATAEEGGYIRVSQLMKML